MEVAILGSLGLSHHLFENFVTVWAAFKGVKLILQDY